MGYDGVLDWLAADTTKHRMSSTVEYFLVFSRIELANYIVIFSYFKNVDCPLKVILRRPLVSDYVKSIS